ncbi:glycolate oxidase [Alkalihalobacillus alcalophilus ATCC 27647 = CGMCC 1.3604]|uniref:Glycolate oxidase iron-sulfur subunit n=1 Tax=Alkalihalobacillus alcalophilus ATCC 27647 = CGMCC 1.3604 TaxID=1218173 RepID=A0A094YZK3_ALKAL|nr:(Fe-S)-binding protein [Alkalihalobacillus alcalophilus]KGA98997.1 glycolate oxidase [Alkalihalobacillus alcalophilus ATCC 27647 = CGMCC 1.3604]MED1560632.1 (Fe-S)-binding protein [Alkalihalobacillus alcalophilus]THG88746.1 glycolate oxidase [Alkalihalobacillus alcalophilus ATCC 27647 = CGMCC 1.3604]
MNIIEKERIQKQFQEKMDYDELLNCMRCGFCLPTCPTYIESGKNELHSPRGRIAIMKAVVDGDIEPDEEVKKSLDMCLGCRACEPVCPSGVKYGHLLEEARDIIYQNKKPSLPVKGLREVVFNQLFPHQNRMVGLVGLLGFYQRSGISTLARKSGMLKVLPDSMQLMEKVIPLAPRKKEIKNRPTHLEPLAVKKKNVAFFSGCLMDTVFMKTNEATKKLLQYAGCEIVIPKTQGCCGALHGHSGEKMKAKEMAKKNIEAFEKAEVDYIITNAGGCGAFLVDYDHLLKDDPEWVERAKGFANKIKDITSILIELKFDQLPLQLNEEVLTYQDSCHLRNGQKTFIEPRKLLQSISGSDFVEMKNADRCCGSAGIYNIVESEMSMQILDYKMEQTKKTKAKTIVTANPGCLLQMKLGIEKEGLSEQMRAIHIVDLLLEAYENAKNK